MGEKEPESKDGLGKDVEDGVCDNLGVNIDVARSISNAPDAMTCQWFTGSEEACDLTLDRWSRGSG